MFRKPPDGRAYLRERGEAAANSEVVKDVLENHPDVFVMRTGRDAQALGRSFAAKLYRLPQGSEEAEEDANSLWAETPASSTASALHRRQASRRQPTHPPRLTSPAEAEALDADTELQRIEEKFGSLNDEDQRGRLGL